MSGSDLNGRELNGRELNGRELNGQGLNGSTAGHGPTDQVADRAGSADHTVTVEFRRLRSEEVLDDIAESYLSADPDLVADYADAAATDPVSDDHAAEAADGEAGAWQAEHADPAPGGSVRVERAAWWDHAVQSRRSGQAGGPGSIRKSAPAVTSASAGSPVLPGRASRLERVKRVERARMQQRAVTPKLPASAAETETRTMPEFAAWPHPDGPPVAAPATGQAPAAPATGQAPAAPATGKAPAAPATGQAPAAPATGQAPATAESATEKAPATAESATGEPATANPSAPSALATPAALAHLDFRPKRSFGQSARTGPLRHGPVTAGIAALVLVLVAAATLTLLLSSRKPAPPASNSQVTKKAAAAARAEARSAAAGWIVSQVDRRALVACDPVMCDELTQRGFPARDLDSIKRSAAYPLTATLIVTTPAISKQFNARVTGHWAPVVLGSFGRGSDRVEVRIIAPHGVTAYRSALRADRKLSKKVGTGLVTSRQVTAAAAARKVMTSGQVDARLLIVITALASEDPIHIVRFGASPAGATPGLPRRIAELAAFDPAAHLTEKVYVQALEELLRAQPAKYRPVRMAVVSSGGKRALRIEFAAPTPLGMLSPGR